MIKRSLQKSIKKDSFFEIKKLAYLQSTCKIQDFR